MENFNTVQPVTCDDRELARRGMDLRRELIARETEERSCLRTCDVRVHGLAVVAMTSHEVDDVRIIDVNSRTVSAMKSAVDFQSVRMDQLVSRTLSICGDKLSDIFFFGSATLSSLGDVSAHGAIGAAGDDACTIGE